MERDRVTLREQAALAAAQCGLVLATPQRLGSLQRDVLEHMTQDAGLWTYGEIARALGMDAGAQARVRHALGALLARGLVHRGPMRLAGRWGRTPMDTWRLTDAGILLARMSTEDTWAA